MFITIAESSLSCLIQGFCIIHCQEDWDPPGNLPTQPLLLPSQRPRPASCLASLRSSRGAALPSLLLLHPRVWIWSWVPILTRFSFHFKFEHSQVCAVLKTSHQPILSSVKNFPKIVLGFPGGASG